MMKALRIAALAGMIGLGLAAQDVRVYVNLETAFDGYYKTAAANVSFEERKQETEDRLSLIQKELESLNEEGKKLDAEMRNELLSREAREAAGRKLQMCVERLRAKNRDFEKARRDAFQQLQRIRQEREEELLKEILEVIGKVADEKKATEVVEVSGKTLNRAAVYLRYPKEKEITAELVKRLNAGHEDELKRSQAELERRRKAASKPELPAGR